MRAQPGDGFADPDAKRLAALEPGNEAFDLRVVENAGMGFVTLEVANQLRGDLANKIGGNSHNFRRGHAEGGGDLRINLVPSQNLVAGNVECLSHRLFVANQSRQSRSKIGSRR